MYYSKKHAELIQLIRTNDSNCVGISSDQGGGGGGGAETAA